MEYFKLFRKLSEKNVRYLICGGLAVNIYGIPRMTSDIDLLIGFDQENVQKFNRAVQDLSFTPRIPVALDDLRDEGKRHQMIKEKNLIAYSYYNTRSNYVSLDVLMDTPISFEQLWANREERPVEPGLNIHIVSLNDLIALKRYANRNQDHQDILMLSKLSNIKAS